ncbi:MAG: AIR carboxylase family protein, partial [Planctomycetes bacterium]|nr:AIR carboxylase family protein [Planctomycetota bacterium]
MAEKKKSQVVRHGSPQVGSTSSPQVAIVMGSDSDMAVMQSCIDTLEEFGISPQVRILSAHRTPKAASEFAQNAAENGIKVIIAAAGMA